MFRHTWLIVLCRLTPIKLLKKPTNGKNKKRFAIEILTVFDSGSAAREAEDVVEGKEEITITIDALAGSLGLHHLGAVPRLADTTIALLHQDVKLILTFQAAEIRAVWTIEDVLHHPSEGPFPAQHHDLGHLPGITGVEMTTAIDLLDVAIPPADLQHQYAEALVGMEGDGIEDVVIERDPMNRQKLLAHVPLEDIGEDALLPFHLVAPLHRPGRETIGEGGRYHLYQGHVLVH